MQLPPLEVSVQSTVNVPGARSRALLATSDNRRSQPWLVAVPLTQACTSVTSPESPALLESIVMLPVLPLAPKSWLALTPPVLGRLLHVVAPPLAVAPFPVPQA